MIKGVLNIFMNIQEQSPKKAFIASGPAVSFLKSKKKLILSLLNNYQKLKLIRLLQVLVILILFILKVLFMQKKEIHCSSILDDWNEYKKRFTFKK